MPEMSAGNVTDDSPAVSCAACEACCCRLEVLLMSEDDVPSEFTHQDQWGGWVMDRLADGWCAALDRSTMRCTVYACRPIVCREYEMGESDCIEERIQFYAQAPAGRAGRSTRS